MKYKIKNWWKRVKRALNWALFIYKQPHYQEYESFLAIIEKRLISMAVEFEKTDITMSSAQDAKRMRLAAKLLRIYIEEKYENDYIDLHWNNQKSEFLPTYDIVRSRQMARKDIKAMELAFKIVAQNLPGWWQ